MVKITVEKLAPDPNRPVENRRVSMSTHMVFDVEDGYTAAEQKNVVDGFITMLTASSGLLLTKILAGES
jgi:hypothetical protein